MNYMGGPTGPYKVMRGASPAIWPVVFCLLPLLSPTQQHYQWATAGLLWGLWTLSLNIVWGYAGQLSLAQFGLGAMSGYTFTLLITRVDLGLSAAILIAVGLTVAASLVLSGAALRLRGFYFAILTITFALVVLTLLRNWETAGRTSGLLVSRSVLPEAEILGLTWNTASRAGGFFALVASVFLLLNAFGVYLARSPAGAAMMAVREDEVLAASLGMNVLHVKTLAFLLSAAVAGVAGILQVLSFQLAVPELFGVDQALLAVMLLVLAGLGSVHAPTLAAVVYVSLYEAAPISGPWRGGLLGAIVVAIILFLPRGTAAVGAAAYHWLRQRLPLREQKSDAREPVDDESRDEGVDDKPVPVRRTADSGSLLKLIDVERRFGGIVAVDRISFEVMPGEIVGLVGPNGAGKTTLINVISGFDRATRGQMLLGLEDIGQWTAHRLARRGIVRSFQHARVFASMTVAEALLVGAHVDEANHRLLAMSGLLRRRKKRAESLNRAQAILRQLRLQMWATTQCQSLPYGIKKRVGLAILLMRTPALFLLDEPAAGLNSMETMELKEDLRRLNHVGHTMLIVEHNMPLIMSLSDRVVVLDHGAKLAEGAPSDIVADPHVKRAYLGHR